MLISSRDDKALKKSLNIVPNPPNQSRILSLNTINAVDSLVKISCTFSRFTKLLYHALIADDVDFTKPMIPSPSQIRASYSLLSTISQFRKAMIISAIVSVILKKSTSSSSATVLRIFTIRPKTPPEKTAHNSITRSKPSTVVVICLILSSESSRLLTKFENASMAFMRISSAEGNSLNTSFQVSLTAEPILLIFSHNVPNALMILSRPPSLVMSAIS